MTSLQQLEWRFLSEGVRPATYRVPSWSWAYVDGLVYFSNMSSLSGPASSSPLLKILEAHIELAGEDEFGQVSRGHLRVRGQLIGIEIRDSKTILVDGEKTKLQLFLDNHSSLDRSPQIRSRGFWCFPRKKSPFQLHCLPLFLGHKYTYAGVPSHCATLILEQIDH